MTAQKQDRIYRFCRVVCNEWSKAIHTDCVMNNPDAEPCTKKNCQVYPVAVEALAKLDARDGKKANSP